MKSRGLVENPFALPRTSKRGPESELVGSMLGEQAKEIFEKRLSGVERAPGDEVELEPVGPLEPDFTAKEKLLMEAARFRREENLSFEKASVAALSIKENYDSSPALAGLVDAFVQVGRLDQAREMVLKIELAGDSAKALSILIPALIRAGRYVEAKDLARHDTGLGQAHRSKVFSVLVSSLAEAGQDTSEVLKDALEGALWVTEDVVRDQHLSLVVQSMAKTGNLELISAAIKELELSKYGWHAVSSLSSQLAQVGLFAEAQEIVSIIKRDEIHSKSLVSIATALDNAGLDASSTFKKAEELAANIEDDAHRVRALSCLASGLSQTGHDVSLILAEARETALNIKDVSRSDALFALASTLVNTGALAEAEEIALEIGRSHLHSEALIAVLTAFVKAGCFEKAYRVAEKIRPGIYRSMGFSVLAQALAQFGRHEEAKKIILEITEYRYRDQSLQSLILDLAQAGQLDEAIEVASQIKDQEKRIKVLCSLIISFDQAGHDCSDIIGHAEGVISEIESDGLRSEGSSELALALVKVGRDASETFKEATTLASLEGSYRSAKAYTALALAYSESAKILKARAGEMKD